MSCEYAKKHYNVPACIGRRVSMSGREGIIAEDRGHYIGVLFDDSKPNNICSVHPNELQYFGMGKVRQMTRSQKRYRDYLRSETSQTYAEYIGVLK